MAKRRKLSNDEALKLAWQRGFLSYKLFDYQRDLYQLVSTTKALKTVFNISRRYGKSTVLMLWAIEYGIRNPYSMIRFASPTQKSLKKSLEPIIRQLISDAPRALRPKWLKAESMLKLHTGSEIHLAGCNGGNEENLRGQKCDLGIIDEAGAIDNLRYVYTDVILPQCLTCNGHVLIASTPPPVEDHDFYHMCQEAKEDGDYLEKTIYDNKSLTPELIASYAKESGGVESVTFRREYLCKFETEQERLIIPEYRDSMVCVHPRDEFFDYYHKYVFMDLGVTRHYTSTLFGYYDFRKSCLVIENEFKMRGDITTLDIANSIKAMEKELWGNLPVNQRIADNNNPLLINDLAYLHNLNVVSTNKDTLEAMINELRMFVGAGKLKIHPRCEFLIGCLKFGVWKDKKLRQMFAESKKWGHYDALAAIMYGVRNLDQNTNPIPHLYGLSDRDHFIHPEEKQRTNKNLNEFAKLFGNVKKAFNQ
jgi:hypothetical protein